MDGLSVAASIMAVLDLTAKVIKYAKEAKDASAERNRLLKDVINIKGSLHALQSHVEISDPDEPWMHAVQGLTKPGGPLEVYKAALEHLLEKLSPPHIDGKRSLVKRLGSSLVWPFQAGEVSEILATIERQQKLFDLAMSLDSMALTRAIHADAQDSKKIHRVMTSDLQQARSEIHQILEEFRTETEIKVLESLSTMRPREQHADTSSRRAPNTCEWVRENRTFMDWLQGSGSSNVIWCSGIPGSGKTFVTSMVIDYLGSIANEQDMVTAYVYCDYKAHQKQPDQAPLSIAGALLRQFMSVEKRIPSRLVDLYHQNMRDGSALQMSTLEDLLVDYCRGRSTYIVIDALDESGLPDVRRTFLRLLKRLENTKSRLFFTTRPGQKDIERYLKGRPCIPIEATALDITRFLNGRIDERMEEEEELEDLLSEELRGDIISTLVQRSHGMFLLPDLQIRTVLDQVSTAKIREALVTLPEGLEAQFEASISRIKRQPKARRDLAIRTIMWIAHAMETIELGALQHALSVETGDRNLVHSRMTPLSLLRTSITDFCQGLITIQQETSQVRLAHFTLFEYFFERRHYDSWFCSSERLIAETCLTYLLFDDFASNPPSNDDAYEDMLRIYPLYDYSARRWGIHVHRLYHHSPPQLMVDLMYKFIFSSLHLERAVQAFSSSAHQGVSSHGYSQIYPKILSPIHVSALFGIPAIAGEVLKQGPDIDIAVESEHLRGWTALHFAADNTIGDPCGSWMTDFLIENGATCDLRSKDRGEIPLHIAARNGRAETLKALLNANADMQVANDDGWKPIHAATEHSHIQALTYLLEAGCQVSPKTTHGLTTPLHQAIANRKHEIIELLLCHNADIEAVDRFGNAPIHAAARAGQYGALAKLLEKGVSIEAHDNNYLTPLMVAAAANEGSEECTKLLLQRGAAVHKRSRANDSALLFAALNGNLNAAAILLDAGAELNGQHELLDTALHTAASKGHESVCRMLLERGANVDPLNEVGNTPLALTVDEPSNKSIVELLLSHHANVNAQNGQGYTVLHRAVSTECKNSTVVELLLQRGADLTKKSEEGYTALQVAAANGNSSILECLVQAGVDPSIQSTSGLTALHLAARHDVDAAKVLVKAGCPVNTQNSIGQTALHIAVVAACTEVVEYLLQNGALVHSKDECGQVASYFAAVDGAEDIMQLLLHHGAQVDERESKGVTLLHAAASHGHSKIVELLIRNGAKVDSRDEDGLTPLIMACENGHTETAQRLLAHGANINAYGGTGEAVGWNSLFFAAQDNHLPVVRMLLSKGIDRRSPVGEQEWTPLHSASGNGHLDIVRALVDTGDYNLDAPAGPSGLSPLHFAVLDQSQAMLSLLLDRGAAIETGSKKACTPLYIACSLGGAEATTIVRFLLEQGAHCFTKSSDGVSCLHMAARWGLPATIKVLLERGIDINMKRPDGWRPLQAAIQAELLENVRTLITRGADIHIVDDDGNSDLHESCKIGSEGICRLLLDEGAKIDGVNKDAQTPLHIAIMAPHPLVARLLLDRGANIDAQDNVGCSTLARAVWNAVLARQLALESSAKIAKLSQADSVEGTSADQCNLGEDTFGYLGNTKELAESDEDELTTLTKTRADHVCLVQILLQMGADVSLKDTYQCTPLNHAASHADLEISTILIDAGADIRAGENAGVSPFISAVWSEDIEYVQAILTLTKYDLNDQSRSTNTPLGEALCTGDIPMFYFLRSRGASLETKNMAGETALFAALRKDNASELVAFLLCEGSDPNARSNDQTPAIFPAVVNVNTNILEVFLSKGADVGVLGSQNETALHWAMEPHLLETFTWLLVLNIIDVDAKDTQGRTSLLMAAALGYVEHATLLLDHGADIETLDSCSTTPLIVAATEGHLKVVQLLLDRDASVGAKDEKGRDSLSYAVRNGFEEIVRLLLGFGAKSNTVDAGGRPALQYAANRGHEGILKLLIEHGADVTATTNKGSTAVAAARAGGYKELSTWIQGLIDAKDKSGMHCQLVDRTAKR